MLSAIGELPMVAVPDRPFDTSPGDMPGGSPSDWGWGHLVREDAETFEVHTDIYTASEVFEAEMRAIFERGWVYVAHESQIPRPGDYRTATVGKQPVVVGRHESPGSTTGQHAKGGR
jgi:hypothetical protein